VRLIAATDTKRFFLASAEEIRVRVVDEEFIWGSRNSGLEQSTISDHLPQAPPK
jgi:hypothetical protein